MTNKSYRVLFGLSFCLLALAFTSCDDDFSEVGSSLVDNSNFDAELYTTNNLNTYSSSLDRVATNGLPVYQLGTYHDGVYGKTKANLLTQVSLSNPNPQFQDSAELDSVVMTIPYYSRLTEQTFEEKTYELDSVYGNGRIDFSIYRSNYYLRNFDPDDEYNSQKYYSDQASVFESNLDPDPIVEVNNYRPVAEPLTVINEDKTDTTTVSPRMRISLPKDYFKSLILDNAGSNALISNSNFRDFFRGLYFKVESETNQGVMTYLNFASEDAKITLYYNYDFTDVNGEVSNLSSSYDLNFGPSLINTFDTQNNTPPQQENIKLKGYSGSIGVVDLFPDESELDSIRDLDWLVNDANLRFYVNEEELPASYEQPERIFVYDLESGQTLSDYEFASDVLKNDILNSRRVHLGRLSEDDEGNAYYKIRLTNYMNNLMSSDSTHTKIGVSVSQNVNIPNTVATETDNDTIDQVPATSAVSPRGTILYGAQAPVEAKRLELEIFYTETQ